MIKYKAFYRNFFSIYTALVLQQVITLSVNLADNMMLGAYNETALSGVAAVNQIQFIFQQILMALGEGVVILCSQYWGRQETAPMKKITASAMRAALLMALLLFLCVSLFPVQIVGLFTSDQGIVNEGVRYLNVVRFGFLFFAVTLILLSALRSVEIVKISLYLSVMAFLINCAVNYLLIYGRLGFPELGVQGAAVGTVLARVIECIVLLVYFFKQQDCLKFKIRDFLTRDTTLERDYIRVTFPMFVTQSLWGVSTALQTVILGHMTAAAIAANSVASTLFLIVKSAAVGAASTASVIIGKAVGGEGAERAKEYSRILQKTFVVIGIIGGILLFLIRIPILHLYDLSPQTKQMADQFLIVLSVIYVGMSYQMPAGNGIIRGGGDPAFVAKLNLVSIWLIVLPVSFLAAFVFKASPLVVVCCLNADQVFKCVPTFIKVNYGKWIYNLTRKTS